MNVSTKYGFGKRLLGLLLAIGFSSWASAGADTFFGAIYDTGQSGTEVDQNIWPSKNDVYLNGGPQNDHSNGLPDGTYYFQVTDPSGETLLSTDSAVCRLVSVTGGRLSGPAASGRDPECKHVPGTYNEDNKSTGVQLMPYSDTPNAGGEYKVWLIQQSCATINSDDRRLTFNSNCAKTDNFKIKPPADECGGANQPACPCGVGNAPACETPRYITIGGLKYYDNSANGYLDEATEGTRIGGVVVRLYLNNSTSVAETFITGNADGVWGPKQLCVERCPAGETTVGSYKVCEATIDNQWWKQTGPATGAITEGSTANALCWEGLVTASSVEDLFLDFGNLCYGQSSGGGLTLGYWSNKAAAKIIADHSTSTSDPNWLATLRDMNLVQVTSKNNYAGVPFNPTQPSQVSSFLLAANATNMAVMLSAQLTAMKLNVLNGNVSGLAMVYAPQTGGAGQCAATNAGDFISIADLMACANTELLAHPTTIDGGIGSAFRPYQTALKNALDKGNNNVNFATTNSALCPAAGVTLTTLY